MIEHLSLEKILKEALKEGGEFADLFFERTYSVVVVCEEDRIEKMISGQDIGIGLRVLFEGRTFYSFTNRLEEEDLLNLARVVSRAGKEESGEKVINLLHQKGVAHSSPSIHSPLSPIEKHPQEV